MWISVWSSVFISEVISINPSLTVEASSRVCVSVSVCEREINMALELSDKPGHGQQYRSISNEKIQPVLTIQTASQAFTRTRSLRQTDTHTHIMDFSLMSSKTTYLSSFSPSSPSRLLSSSTYHWLLVRRALGASCQSEGRSPTTWLSRCTWTGWRFWEQAPCRSTGLRNDPSSPAFLMTLEWLKPPGGLLAPWWERYTSATSMLR